MTGRIGEKERREEIGRRGEGDRDSHRYRDRNETEKQTYKESLRKMETGPRLFGDPASGAKAWGLAA